MRAPRGPQEGPKIGHAKEASRDRFGEPPGAVLGPSWALPRVLGRVQEGPERAPRGSKRAPTGSQEGSEIGHAREASRDRSRELFGAVMGSLGPFRGPWEGSKRVDTTWEGPFLLCHRGRWVAGGWRGGLVAGRSQVLRPPARVLTLIRNCWVLRNRQNLPPKTDPQIFCSESSHNFKDQVQGSVFGGDARARASAVCGSR